jgi:Cdc6-like AAA superfamily ATPase
MIERDIKINNWLLPSDSSTNFNEAKGKRHEGTGSWFLESERFKEWKFGSRQCLWLHGIPGCGKTVLCSTIIENLRQNKEDSSHIVLDFFFDFKDEQKRSLDGLVRSLIAQLYSRCEHSRKELDTLFSSCEDGRLQPTSDSLFTTFQRMMNHAEKIQMVIDALDECQTKKELLLWIEKLSSSGHAKVCLLIVSRKEEEIGSRLRRWLQEENFISVHRDTVDSDIRLYVRATLRADNGFQRWRLKPSVLEEIETELMKKANGM